MRKPALAVALCFGSGALLQPYIAVPLYGSLSAAVGCFAVAIVAFARSHTEVCSFCLCAGFLATGALRFEMAVHHVPWDHYMHHMDGREVLLQGEIVSEPEMLDTGYRAEMAVAALSLSDTTWQTSGILLIRFSEGIAQAAYGDSLCLRATPYVPDRARNPGGFDYREYLNARGIRALARITKPEQVVGHLPGRGAIWMRCILPIRRTIKAAIEQNLSGGPAGLLKGILLGDKRAVPKEVRAAFTRCGVNHVLAVSGLHVGLIAGVVFLGLQICGFGRAPTALVTMGVVILYALVTGLPPSVIRATLMAGLVILSGVSEWESNGWNALGAAGLFGLIARPGDVLNVGFQLSFAATAGILLFYQPILGCLPVWGGRRINTAIWSPLAVSLAAQLATMPFIVTYFGIVSIVGILANLVVVPLMCVAAALGLISIFLYPVLPLAVVWLNGANWLVLKIAIYLAEVMGSPPWAVVELSHLPFYQWLIYGLAVMLVLPELRKGTRAACVLGGILLCANYGVWKPVFVPNRNLEMVVLDIGQGDSIFLRFPNGKVMLIDGGIRSLNDDKGLGVVLPFLRSQGIFRIDVMVGSHAHSDHIGGLVSVLSKMRVDHYLDSGQIADSWTSREVRRLVAENGIRYHQVAAGDSLVGLGGVGALILHPEPVFGSEESGVSHGLNNGSVVIRLDYCGRKILLTGDIERETDGALLRWGDRLHADILKAAHHGSRTSSSIAFLRGVSPSWVAVSCGIKNKFRHPSPEVIARYKDMGVEVLRTDLGGAIRFVVGRDSIYVRTCLSEDK
jgi:competence protein ComEC